MLVTMASTLREKVNAVADAQAELDRLTADLNHFQLVTIPEAMELAGVGEYTMTGQQARELGLDGVKLIVKDDVKASIAQENRPFAHEWLRTNGHGGVIKEAMLVDLRALDDTMRARLKATVRTFEVEPEPIESVHPATLKSLVKELLEGGVTPPPSISVFQFKKAELKEPRMGKGKK